MITAIETTALTVAYDDAPVLLNLDLRLPAGQMIGVVGPNGAGKSTLIKALLGLVPVAGGCVHWPGCSCAATCAVSRPTNRRNASGRIDTDIAYVPQRSGVDWDFPITVFDLVMMGTYGRLRWFARPGRSEREQAAAAIDRVGMTPYARRQIGQLSGGQQQRAFIARALVQNPSVYLLDEPFAGVDVTTEESLVDCLRELRDTGKTIVTVHHDLSTVPQYFDHVLMINRRVIASGPTETVFTPDNIRRTYGRCVGGSGCSGADRAESADRFLESMPV